jgi:hypothetical protein
MLALRSYIYDSKGSPSCRDQPVGIMASCTVLFLHAGSLLENSRDVGVEQIQPPVYAIGIKVEHVSITIMPGACRPP